ncbi:hypothetical protein, partial [Zymomonas mobilis]|uniref:hypothetical protein n=1 Tax=Zymomonas mobilis TaxID=542 RepID=UPI0039E94BDC
FGIAPQDVAECSTTWWYELIINIVAIIVLIGLGAILPLITRRENKYGQAFSRGQWSVMLILLVVAVIGGVYLGGTQLPNRGLWIAGEGVLALFIIWFVGRRHGTVKH